MSSDSTQFSPTGVSFDPSLCLISRCFFFPFLNLALVETVRFSFNSTQGYFRFSFPRFPPDLPIISCFLCPRNSREGVKPIRFFSHSRLPPGCFVLDQSHVFSICLQREFVQDIASSKSLFVNPSLNQA